MFWKRLFRLIDSVAVRFKHPQSMTDTATADIKMCIDLGNSFILNKFTEAERPTITNNIRYGIDNGFIYIREITWEFADKVYIRYVGAEGRNDGNRSN